MLRALCFCTLAATSSFFAYAEDVEISFERSPLYNLLSIYANLQDCIILYDEEEIPDRIVTFVTESPLTKAQAISEIEDLIEAEGFSLDHDAGTDYLLTRILSDADLSAKREAEGAASPIEYEIRRRVISMNGPPPRILFIDSDGKRWAAPPRAD